MKNDITSNFYFDNYIIKKIDLDFNQDFESEDPVNLEFDLDINTSIEQQEHTGWTQLDILIWDQAEKNNYPFTLSMQIRSGWRASFRKGNSDHERVCKYNGASILFPFLRSAIADVTKSANITPLTLPLINVKKFIDDKSE